MKIETFKVHKVFDGREVTLFPTVIELNEKKYLIDCGYEETFDEFVAGLKKLQIEVADLYAILLSHDDIDHVGALSLFKSKNPNLIVYSSRIEAPYISGERKSERLQQAEDLLPIIPEEQKAWADGFIKQLKGIKRFEVDLLLEDNEKIENEIEIIFTPGHTKGHISFYVPSQKLVIANDAIVVEEQGLDIANPQFTLDLQQAIESVEKIKQLSPKKIICYHGGIVEGEINEKLNVLLSMYKT
ncbi:metal-dependent hydrolase [Sporocytophaga myxococcoides]|uniref:Metal-dependent hydrolase n=1 Tax=Sporocytophaga myxococcoides TaxID=153721 RepID=A0A098LK76_9BACT|nr:MBL fold metallo-hydrolase [Sporocytophaga myxococcoides]GAL87391.1 metal-dependent hydrolase [Sporocytophaga myxococcoides]